MLKYTISFSPGTSFRATHSLACPLHYLSDCHSHCKLHCCCAGAWAHCTPPPACAW